MKTSVKQSIHIHTDMVALFEHLSNPALIAAWWPKACEGEARLGGSLVFTWANDTTLVTTLDPYEYGHRNAYLFGSEFCDFIVRPLDDGAEGAIVHSDIEYPAADVSLVAHIAECWGQCLSESLRMNSS